MLEDRIPREQPVSFGRASRCASEHALPRSSLARFVLDTPPQAVRVLAGIDAGRLRQLIGAAEPGADGRRALLVPLRPAADAHAFVEQIVDFLAAAAQRVWPIWYDTDFASCTKDRLGALAASMLAAAAAKTITAASPVWAERAAPRALTGRSLRDPAFLPAVEIAQLAHAINPAGLILVADVEPAMAQGTSPAALVHALEWVAAHSGGAVVALFDELPPSESPFDRILFGARSVLDDIESARLAETSVSLVDEAWLEPWRGRPHPLSDIEKRLATVLGADPELEPLFAFNQTVRTVRGTSPKVDLLWAEGRLVVEIDGYESHGSRRAFRDDRHRDYELAMSGYTVLRLANEEIAQDPEKAVDKIRDLVRLRQALAKKER